MFEGLGGRGVVVVRGTDTGEVEAATPLGTQPWLALNPYLDMWPFPFDQRYWVVLTLAERNVLLVRDDLHQALQEGGSDLRLIASPNEVRQLEKLRVLVADPEEEVGLMRELVTNGRQFSDTLYMELATTMACQLRCAYCWEQDLKGKNAFRLSRETVDGMERWLDRYFATHPAVRKLHLDILGGEPMLNRQGLDDLLAMAKAVEQRHRLEQLHVSLITNGFSLDRQAVADLARSGLTELQFTIEGPGELHDYRRGAKRGTETYEGLMRLIEAVSDLISIRVRCNFDKHNIEQLPRLLAELVERLVSPGHVAKENIYLSQLRNLLNSERRYFAAVALSADEGAVVTPLIIAMKAISPLGLSLGDFEMEVPCRYAFSPGLTVDPLGYVYDCGHLLGMPEYARGHINEFPNEPKAWKDFSFVNQCVDKNCRYLPACLGGCPQRAWLSKGTFEEPLCELDDLQSYNRSVAEIWAAWALATPTEWERIRAEYERKFAEWVRTNSVPFMPNTPDPKLFPSQA